MTESVTSWDGFTVLPKSLYRLKVFFYPSCGHIGWNMPAYTMRDQQCGLCHLYYPNPLPTWEERKYECVTSSNT